MTGAEIITIIKQDIAKLKDNNINAINIDNLDKYLNDLQALSEKHLTPEERQTKVEAIIEKYRAINTQHIEMFKSVITMGQSALKSAILINGGAAVALLAFIGKVWGNVDGHIDLEYLKCGLMLYTFGVLSATIASGFTYLSQWFYHRHNLTIGKILNVAVIVLVIGSYLLFAMGSYEAYLSLIIPMP